MSPERFNSYETARAFALWLAREGRSSATVRTAGGWEVSCESDAPPEEDREEPAEPGAPARSSQR